MANVTTTLDDQQERHYIGNLLCEEDVFGQTNGCAVGMLFTGSVLLINDLPKILISSLRRFGLFLVFFSNFLSLCTVIYMLSSRFSLLNNSATFQSMCCSTVKCKIESSIFIDSRCLLSLTFLLLNI